ncbi:MAG: hypothetical protein LBI03_11985 [Clostridiales bacterium]|jgi:hypothetical protein|nr:hypothetical protein [Clostridiales bacterium]
MFYRRKSYIVKADFITVFNRLFTEINLPNQTKYGSKFVGRWRKDNGNGTLKCSCLGEDEHTI